MFKFLGDYLGGTILINGSIMLLLFISVLWEATNLANFVLRECTDKQIHTYQTVIAPI